MYLFQLKDSEPRHFTRGQDDGNTVRPQSTRQDQLLAEENVSCLFMVTISFAIKKGSHRQTILAR